MKSSVEEALVSACARIAPTWPLDRFIAVNPYWGFTHQPIEQAAANLSRLCGSPMLPQQLEGTSSRLPLGTDLLNLGEAMTRSISEACATFFDHGQAHWRPSTEKGLYHFWRLQSLHDPCLKSLCSAEALQSPGWDHCQWIERAVTHMDLDQPGLEVYFTALLLSLNGWAAWCAYLGWQARLEGRTDNHLQQFLAIRLAWDWFGYQASPEGRRQEWRQALMLEMARPSAGEPHSPWLSQEARERNYQQSVLDQFAPGPAAAAPTAPVLQAIFCIDVRSEVFRRALEACHPGIQTLGFAGFFGVPAAYRPLGTEATRPQLPGLLSPSLTVTEVAESASGLAEKRRSRLESQGEWQDFRSESLSGFHFVESLGLTYAWKLLSASLGWGKSASVDGAGLSEPERNRIRPALLDVKEADRVALAAGILRAMSLTENFAPRVLLIAHGSSSRNNPHAAGLDCGACCGQSGEVNSRALAGLLNEAPVRKGLAAQGICIPEETRFVAGLHDTTSDDVTLFDQEKDDQEVQTWLQQAARRARRERAANLGLKMTSDAALASAVRRRARDWSQIRPEWGLANNAGFLAAPRGRSRAANLHGRCFLHEYRAGLDPEGAVLEQIMTAPMIVAHWINMQYYASVVDPQRWGSGNKVLHNVVGGNIGVFEGNGGDLRIGLPLQSVHNGEKWMHDPLRLSVWLEAPQAFIDRVLARHDKVRQLVEGGWIHLLRIDPASGEVFRYQVSGQTPAWIGLESLELSGASQG